MEFKAEPIDLDFDSQMEPFRVRSNTWPQPRPDANEFGDDGKCDMDGNGAALGQGMVDPSVMPQTGLSHSGHDSSSSPLDQSMVGSQGPKKNTSRRNAWGNMSYADLITQAINGSPDKRLTLSQIYDWMVQNVPYFKDKGDSNSSAGWKNSIRHNLSLHNRFMRVQNEGTGKSSWWMINPDAKPGKAARRRATSMETSKYEKKRGRVKKKIEALKNGLSVDQTTPSPSSSVSEGLDMFPDSPLHHAFQLSPEFRPRASSNASSCGRLSPIPAVDNDMHDSQVPPLSPLNPWNSDLGHLYTNGLTDMPDQYGNTEQQLVELANLKLGANNNAFLAVNKTSPTGQLSPAGSHLQLSPVGSHVQLSPAGSHLQLSPAGAHVQQPGAGTHVQLSPAGSHVQLSPAGSHVQLNQYKGLNNFGAIQTFNYTSRTPNATKMDSSSLALAPVASPTSSSVTSLGTTATQVMGHLLSLNNQCLPNDLDLNFDSLQGGLECDVDSVIRHELSVEGSLDFNFDSGLHHSSNATQTSVAHSSTMTTAPSSRSWVH